MRTAVYCVVVMVGSLALITQGGVQGAGVGDPKAGAALFKQNCARCHGALGKGDGPATKVLNPKPHDLTDKKFMNSLSDDDLYKTIAKGGAGVGKSKAMPVYEAKLKEKEIGDLVAFLRSLAQQ